MYLGHLIGCVMIGKVRQHYHLGIVSEYVGIDTLNLYQCRENC